MVVLNLNAIIKAENMGYKKEDLQNTWGIVESNEHARYIAVLADSHDFFCSNYEPRIDNFFYIDDEDLDFLKSDLTPIKQGARKITIPLPPKEVEEMKNNGDNLTLGCEDSKCDEWPQVSSKARTATDRLVIILAINGCNAWVKYEGELVKDELDQYNTVPLSQLQKPKTPEEELRDDLINTISSCLTFVPGMLGKSDEVMKASHEAACNLMGKYNITKKV